MASPEPAPPRADYQVTPSHPWTSWDIGVASRSRLGPTILEHDPESGYRSSENSTLPQQARAGSLGGVLIKRATEMMRPDAGLHSGQGRWQVSEPCSTWPRDHFCRTPSTASVMGRLSATIVPILHSAASNLIRTPSSRSDMSGCRRLNSFRTAGAATEISPFVTSNIVLKSGVPSRSTVIRTFIVVLRTCRCSVQG